MDGLFKMHKRKLEDGSGRGEQKTKQRKQSANPGNKEPTQEHGARTFTKTGNAVESQPPEGVSTVDKIANLLDALADILSTVQSDDSRDALLQAIGKESFEKCADLQSHLNQQIEKNDLHISRRLKHTYPGENIPHILSGLQLSGLKSSEIPFTLPPLPEIKNQALERAAFTHQGVGSGLANSLNYEKLEWIGDTYIEHTVTIFISQTFSSRSPGRCTQLREKFVKNVTLAEYATKYDFHKRAHLPDSITNDNQHNSARASLKVKILGDVFEAYVAAIVLSDPAYGLARATQWLKDLLGMTLEDEIIREEADAKLCRNDNPLWNLQWSDKYDIEAPVPRGPNVDRNPKENLATALRSPGVRLDYKDIGNPKKGKDNLMVFTVGVYLTGWGEKDLLLGFGSGGGKKQAGQNAAQAALNKRTLIKKYAERKDMHHEQMRKEKELLERQGLASST